MLGRVSRNTVNEELAQPLTTAGAVDNESVRSSSVVHRPYPAAIATSLVSDDDFTEKGAQLQIDFDSRRKKSLAQQRFSHEFRFNVQMSLRVACGVLIASSIQARVSNYDPADPFGKKWVFFPSWYYLGGLSYCAISVIFTTGKTIGSTLMVVWQAFLGVGMALVYSLLLFACMDVETQDKQAPDPYAGYVKMSQAFTTGTYWVNLHNFYTTLPWMISFTVLVLVCPFASTTKKFAVSNNLYFILTIIDPKDPIHGSGLKTSEDVTFGTANILRNLAVYFVVGILGSLVSLVIMFVPYPVFAMNRLRKESTRAASDIIELLNIIVDSYCFKNKNVEHMKFLKLKLQRKFDAVAARHHRMEALLEDAWWEQSFGFHYVLGFHHPIMVNYVTLVGSLISDLRTLNYAMELEQYEHLHMTYMTILQREVYIVQSRSAELLHEIACEVQSASREVDLASIATLKAQMETTLHHYRSVQSRTLRTHPVTLSEMAGNVPFNLFLFSLNSFCITMIDFQDTNNTKNYTDVHRTRLFLQNAITHFFTWHHYTNGQAMLAAIRGSLAIVLGIFLSVFVYAFDSTVPSTIAYVMGCYLGSSFRATVNRVGGVVAGSIIPSLFQVFIAQVRDPRYLNVILSNIAVAVWVFLSMYVYYAEGYSSYVGLVSAFVSASILLRQSDVSFESMPEHASFIAISSYSTLAQTSVGVVLFVVVELVVCPHSAMHLLRRNIQTTLKLQLEAFEVLYGHHLTSSCTMEAETMDSLREILLGKIPAQLSKQANLLMEAEAEPLLWRAAVSSQKYKKIRDSLRRLLNNNTLLFKLVCWFNYRVEQNQVDIHGMDIRDGRNRVRPSGDDTSVHDRWQLAATYFQTAMTHSFKTLAVLFSDAFLYADLDQTAIFMQMKEAFRLADKDCSGEIDVDEVAEMLTAIFVESGVVKRDEIYKYVDEFMGVVDKDSNGCVSFEEFMEALENGLMLEVKLYTRRKPKIPALTAKRSNTSSGIDETTLDLQKLIRTRNAQSSVRLPVTPDARDKIDTCRRCMSTNDSYCRSFPTPSIEKDRRFSLASSSDPAWCREHDFLSVEEFSSADSVVTQMKSAYMEWLLADQRYEKVSTEELLLLNCFVSSAEGIAKSLADVAEIVVTSYDTM
ncbi:hypothetical protein PsorP6_016811 [Peronosclerospora sorghi]|uniref:Uncharacterized protein n=1 Tax=Peronosclerospora sorghi TaxID=230839 RepID=A0ACC0WEH9_9STRA|nr:hypothetical protein PsorP6_016811 [Peronosclerospora sorghi]